jgi:hypothetical protein
MLTAATDHVLIMLLSLSLGMTADGRSFAMTADGRKKTIEKWVIAKARELGAPIPVGGTVERNARLPHHDCSGDDWHRTC